MRLYHFTSRRHLRGIAEHGLTVGDVPTDIHRNQGRVGVWLTSAQQPNGHGLGGATDKTAFRLTLEIADDAPGLFRWTEWAQANVTPLTFEALKRADGRQDQTWFVYFGVLPSVSITECFDFYAGKPVTEWPHIPQAPLDLPGVPSWRRAAWHKSLLKKVAKVAARA